MEFRHFGVDQDCMTDQDQLHRRLEAARHDLLELSTRNRLIDTPRRRTRTRSLEVVDELSEEVFRILVREGRTMTFLPKPDKPVVEEEQETSASEDATADDATATSDTEASGNDDSESDTDDDDNGGEESDTSDPLAGMEQPEDDEDTNSDSVAALAARHIDTRLQTMLTSEALQKRLLRTFYDARTFADEQGVNTLFLAIGFIKWYEDDSSKRDRHAPLLLIPVALERKSAKSRFKIRYLDEEINTNLSLQAKLKADFGLDLPEVPDADDLSPQAYFDEVAEAIAVMPRWEVLSDVMVLSFFSFSRFLMYRDLDPSHWPDNERSIARDPQLASLLGDDGFLPQDMLCGDDDKIDPVIPLANMSHIMDADTSQTLVIEEVRNGRNLVIQGPPGTGKSQTITNLIAAAVKDGQRVLFVAEKRAALEVVKRRLDKVGLGCMCLELHSHKANKRSVLEDLQTTLELGRPKAPDSGRHLDELRARRDRLSEHATAMHEVLEPSGMSPFQALGELVQLRHDGLSADGIPLPDAPTWTRDDIARKTRALEDTVTHVHDIGTPNQHPWRGVGLNSILPMDLESIGADLPALIETLENTLDITEGLATKIGIEMPVSIADARYHIEIVQRVMSAPDCDRAAMLDPIWDKRRTEITELVEAGRVLMTTRATLGDKVIEDAWTTDLASARQDFAGFGRNFFRFLNGAYRRALARLRGLMTQPLPKDYEARLAIFDQILAHQKARKTVEELDDIGKGAFGEFWRGTRSDWAALDVIEAWEAAQKDGPVPAQRVAAILNRVGSLDSLRGELDTVSAQCDKALESLNAIGARTELNINEAYGAASWEKASVREALERARLWQAHPEALSKWIAYRRGREALVQEGLGNHVAALNDGQMTPDDAQRRFRYAVCETVIRQAMSERPIIAAFDGKTHQRVLEESRELDLERFAINRRETAVAHYQSMPIGGAAIGEMGVLRREMQKRRRHLPLRRLLREAGKAIQAIKPVFMMSPMSVAQFLEPGGMSFDLLMIDEASQVRPVDAFGAIGRCKQIVVVGDEKQLPPTRFFSRVLADVDIDVDGDDDSFRAGDLESILGLCTAQNMSQRMLRWHYRSKHQSLIGVSNREFYENKLYVIPSPVRESDSLGLRFHHITEGTFDRGRSATNRVEAAAVARAVMNHARDFPDLTLGVGTFSIRQRDAILDEVERLRREETDYKEFFNTDTDEPFFVKNLETIQGDERDVIYISVGYGPDSEGKMTMNFGPLSAEGGERRLNVLITRAKRRCEIFSSITERDIDLDRATGRGPKAFRTFLQFARTGELGADVTGTGEPQSVFESEVKRALEEHGYNVAARVGMAGLFIDLAVIDPTDPSRYLLGIECDGPSYFSARSARERDRQRSSVLGFHGWKLHRIWSPDWFQRPGDELTRLLHAIEESRRANENAANARAAAAAAAEEKSEDPGIVREDDGDAGDGFDHTDMTVPYVEAKFRVSNRTPIHEVSPAKVAQVVAKIIEIESPVHEDEVTRRVTTLWGLSRAGSRVTRAVNQGLELATKNNLVRKSGPFYHAPSDTAIEVRNRSKVTSTGLRKPDSLPPEEVCEALKIVIRTHVGVSRDEAVVETGRLFGFRSTSSQLREVIYECFDALMAQGVLRAEGDRVVLASE